MAVLLFCFKLQAKLAKKVFPNHKLLRYSSILIHPKYKIHKSNFHRVISNKPKHKYITYNRSKRVYTPYTNQQTLLLNPSLSSNKTSFQSKRRNTTNNNNDIKYKMLAFLSLTVISATLYQYISCVRNV